MRPASRRCSARPGCGKTTVLRCIAGLQHAARGFCTVDGEVWQDARRLPAAASSAPIGYVFQEASLFPHLSVRRNLLYGAPRGEPAAGSGADRFDEVVDLLGLEALLDRSPQNLSGGERQRVAVGRALLSQPKLLLMDEPLVGARPPDQGRDPAVSRAAARTACRCRSSMSATTWPRSSGLPTIWC